MTMANEELTPEESWDYDDRLWEIIEMWPRLSERKRRELFLLSVWYAIRSKPTQIFTILGGAIRAMVDTVKMRRGKNR